MASTKTTTLGGTLPTEFLDCQHKMESILFENGIACPAEMAALRQWTLSYNGTIAHGDTINPRANITPIATGRFSFQDAVAFAIKSSPKGASMADLREILVHYKEPLEDINRLMQRIGQTAGTLSRNKQAYKLGDLWFWGQPGTTVALATKRQRQARQRTTQQPAAVAA